jgi:U3 small nucleolar RNA-associated protein 20
MDYPLRDKVTKHVEYFVRQLEYALEPGRLSVLSVLTSLIANFPTDRLVQIAELLFVTLSMRLLNDESEECRKKVGRAITCLVEKLPNEERDKLFALLRQFMRQPKVSY